jgi:membrane protease subunit HflK
MRWLFATFGLLAAGYWLTGVTEVRPGEQVVVRRFGRLAGVRGPGLWFGLPWGMDRVDRLAIDRVRRVTVGYQPGEAESASPQGQFLTGDHNLVNVEAIVHFTISNAEDFAIHGDLANDMISRAVEAALTHWIGNRGIDDVLVNGKGALPEVLVKSVQSQITPYEIGIEIQSADIEALYPPEEVKHAFDEVTRAQSSIETRQQEARQDSARMMREAQSDKYRTEQETQAYVKERVDLARAEAGRFELRLQQYDRQRADGANYLAGIWWEEIGKLFARLREDGRLDLLDNHLGKDGLDITVSPAVPRRK